MLMAFVNSIPLYLENADESIYVIRISEYNKVVGCKIYKNQCIFPCTNKKQLENNRNVKYLKHGLCLMKDVKDHRKL